MTAGPVTADQILARIAASPHAGLLHDERALQAALVELMTGSRHPVLAEMGRALARGELGWRDLTAVAAYREVLGAGLAAVQEIDLAGVAAGLDRCASAAHDRAASTPSQRSAVAPS